MTIYGWDASHYDAPQVASAVSDGISFITHKAGGDQADAEFPDWWTNAKGLDPAKVLIGAYWVLYPNNPVTRADAFLARLDAICVGWRQRPFMLQVDCEKWNSDPATMPSPADIRAFCDRLVERTSGRCRPIVYAPKWVYGDTLKGLPYPLWASTYVTGAGHYRALYPGDSSARWGAYSGQTPAILQYSSSATIGNQTTCDANAFRGTLDQLRSLVCPITAQEVPDMDTQQNNALAEAWAADKALRDGADVPAAGNFPGGKHWGVEALRAQADRLDKLTAAVTDLTAQQSQGIDYDKLAAALLRTIAANPAS